METALLSPSAETYSRASEILSGGGLVAFPTETVYGLGANALDSNAVLSVFAAKGRPADNPLIVHIHDQAQLEPLCTLPEGAQELMDAFWPGPLTILCNKKPVIPDTVTCCPCPAAGLQPACGCAFRQQFRTSQSHHRGPCYGGYERQNPSDH